MNLNLTDKVALITGAASQHGIGAAIARALAKEGVRVIVTDIVKAGIDSLAAEIRHGNGNATAYCCDQSNYQQVQTTVEQIISEHHKIDIFINSAALTNNIGTPETMAVEKWQLEMSVSLAGPFYWCKEILPHMKANKWGRIVNISSITSLFGGSGCAGYVAAKGGLNSLMKQLAKDYAKHNVTVNSLVLGVIDTGIYERGDFGEDVVKHMLKSIPVRRMGTSEEVADLAAFIASEKAGFITGSEILIDGGTSVSI